MRPAQSILALAIAVAVLRGSLACNRAPADNGFSLPTPTGFVKREPTQPHVVLVLHHEAAAAKVTDMLIVTAVPLQHPDRPPTIEAEIDSDKRVLTKNHPEAAYGPVETIVVDGADGRLFWIQDAYTTTHRYPYSKPSDAGYNYIRNSVKVVIDAYDGTTKFYLADIVYFAVVAAATGILGNLAYDALRLLLKRITQDNEASRALEDVASEVFYEIRRKRRHKSLAGSTIVNRELEISLKVRYRLLVQRRDGK